jgi:toluene monooxygenase system protein D
MSGSQRPDLRVGPVLESGETSSAIVAAIRELNPSAEVQDRGSYLRVLAVKRCVVTRAAIERALGRPFRLPDDLEPLMPSFKGALTMTEEQVTWS